MIFVQLAAGSSPSKVMINKSPAGVRCTKVLSCTPTASLDSENSGVDFT